MELSDHSYSMLVVNTQGHTTRTRSGARKLRGPRPRDNSNSEVLVDAHRPITRRLPHKPNGPESQQVPVRLPGEITDMIISYVDDRGTLCSCMRVCRDWALASRAVLFEEISIGSLTSYDLLVQRVMHSEALKRYLACTRIFRLDPYYQDPVAHSHQLLHDIAGQLPTLRSLTLGSMDWCQRHCRVTEPLLFSQFRQLRRLSLRDCRMPSFSYVRRALLAAPSLNDLSLFHVTWPWSHISPFPPASYRSHSLPALGRLCIYFTAKDAVVDPLLLWLSQTHSRISISELLVFSHDSSASYRNISAISLRPETLNYLTTLCMHMRLTTLKVSMVGNLSLSIFPRVHTLFLYADALPGPQDNGNESVLLSGVGFWTTLAFMLRDAKFLLQRLYVRNVAGDLVSRNEDRLYSDEVDAILSRNNFKALHLIHFTVVPGRITLRSTLAQIVQSRLPALHSRGLVQVVIVRPR